MSRGYRRYLFKNRGRLTDKRREEAGSRQADVYRQYQPDQHNAESSQHRSVSENIEPKLSNGNANHRNKKPRDPAKWTDWLTVVLTFALFCCAVAAFFVSKWQWQTASDQLNFAEQSSSDTGNDTQAALRISDRLAVAAEKQAKATQSSVAVEKTNAGIARQGLRSALESQVTYFAATMQGIAVGQSPATVLTVQNSGTHSIRDVTAFGTLQMGDADDAFYFHHQMVKGDNLKISLIAAGQHRDWPIGGNVPLDQATLDTIVKDRHRIYLFGYATFYDANGKHSVHFCNVYYGKYLSTGLACEAPPDS